MKKLLAMILCVALCATALVGCGGGGNFAGEEKLSVVVTTDTEALSSRDDVQYVMIYNPNIYDELKGYNEKLNTGDFASSVEAVISKADGLEQPEIPEYVPRSVAQNTGDVDFGEFELEGDRAGKFIVPYRVGDTHDFYYGADSRYLATFTCKYAGQYCNIWTGDNSVGNSEIQSCGQEFDNKIYNEVTTAFGKSRFADNGGKVNILMYPMSGGLGGFFRPLDLFASNEASPAEISYYSMNTDHDIININSYLVDYDETLAYSTIAHEFQHLICFTNYFSTYGSGINMRTWLNEAMSGYIEEKLYAGSKEEAGHYESFVESTRIRHGQSMYNFETTMTNSEFDIGVYGSVYLFSEYLARTSGEDVFSKIHSYWRNSYSSTLDEAEAIANSVSQSTYDEVDSSIDFGELVEFTSENEKWLSKLTLKFYMSLLNYDENDPAAFEKVQGQTLLYDEINPAEIEGGGRVIAALKDGKFEFPEDADHGLIYVGLDAEFNPITEYVLY